MSLHDKISAIKVRVVQVATSCGRDPRDVQIIAVSKTQIPSVVDEAIRGGLDVIGENRVQEVAAKLPLLHATPREFHFIGHLQSNKINKLMQYKPDLIHTIDSLSTAAKLNEYLAKNNMTQRVLVQVNTSGEIAKSGIEPKETLDFVKAVSRHQNICVEGLMTIGKWGGDVATTTSCFTQLARLLDELKIKIKADNVCLRHLSMGMSGDYELAIKAGATLIRLGTTIFGVRGIPFKG